MYARCSRCTKVVSVPRVRSQRCPTPDCGGWNTLTRINAAALRRVARKKRVKKQAARQDET